MFDAARAAGAKHWWLFPIISRTSPLTAGQVDALGLTGVRASLENIAQRPVNIQVYPSASNMLRMGPSILIR
jgi:hypothetical protein